MPPEDLVALMRTAQDAWNRGDVEAATSILDREFEWHTTGDFPDLDPVYRGLEGWRKFVHDLRGPWVSLQVLVDEFHGVDDKVVALATFDARGRDGIELRRPIAYVMTFRDGLALRCDTYGDWDQAREAAGL